jgi:hypothetical protein
MDGFLAHRLANPSETRRGKPALGIQHSAFGTQRSAFSSHLKQKQLGGILSAIRLQCSI